MTMFSNCTCCVPTQTSTGPALARRTFLAGGIAALGLGSIGTPTVRAQAAKTKIDVHHHFLPPAHREALGQHKAGAPKWSVQMSLEDMDKSGIATSVTSIGWPGMSCTSRINRLSPTTRFTKEATLVPLTLVTAARPEVMALAFLVERAHPSYAGNLSLARQVQFIRGAAGRTGSNIDYLVSTLAHLRELGIRERSLERLVGLVGAHVTRGEALEHARPAAVGLTKGGATNSTATLTGTNSYTGVTRVSAGTLTILSLANGASVSAIPVFSAAALPALSWRIRRTPGRSSAATIATVSSVEPSSTTTTSKSG